MIYQISILLLIFIGVASAIVAVFYIFGMEDKLP